MKRITKATIAILILASLALATERAKAYYRIAHISQSIVGISCPGNGGDPTVVTNVEGTLLVSCGQ